MAYSRYDRSCDWYIFWQTTLEDAERTRAGNPKLKANEILAIWHSDHRAEGPEFTYAEVCEMLESSNFGRIPGFSDSDRNLIVACLTEFVRDVDHEANDRVEE